MNIKKKNEIFWIKIDTEYDVFSAEETFKLEYFNDSTGDFYDVTLANFTEIIRSTSGLHATVLETTLKDSFKIKINDGYTLESGKVFIDTNDNKYYIEKILNNEIYLRTPLIEDIEIGTILLEVGNTGIYRKELSISETGEYTIIVRNPEHGMGNIPISIKIVDENIDDIQNKLDIILSNGNLCKYKTFV